MDTNKTEFNDTSDSRTAEGSVLRTEAVEHSNLKGGGEVPSDICSKHADGFAHLDQQDVFLKDRRRARSLPAYPDQATLFNEISQSCRKRVQFADALGLSLASVKHFSAADDPHIPSKVFSRLQTYPPQQDRELLGDLCDKLKASLTLDCLVPTFKQPVESPDFENRVKENKVALEKVTVTHFDIRGLVRVLHFGSRREIGVRYTFNDWLSFVDAQAVAVPGEDSTTCGEKFSFTMYTPPFLDPSCSVHFAVYCKTDIGEFWDNNHGQNYTFRYHCMSPFETAAFRAT
ncbi:protein phosphatase 1 regulatory subunit 3G [Lepisosteus oculatus]|uniref:protein phosphatase 1 regulatory subunit 3G n=1 Tax=Lepisosteus oculatus TaxID=7918 RepID=UPI0003EAAD62|nr:PREDICTED: protein phosphatase 1 regulatory subunit 3G [Lepisosteus oculatus]